MHGHEHRLDFFCFQFTSVHSERFCVAFLYMNMSIISSKYMYLLLPLTVVSNHVPTGNVSLIRAAQRFMIGRSLEWAGVQEGGAAPKTGVDIGESALLDKLLTGPAPRGCLPRMAHAITGGGGGQKAVIYLHRMTLLTRRCTRDCCGGLCFACFFSGEKVFNSSRRTRRRV